MFNPFKSFADLKKLPGQAIEIQRQLEAEEIELNKNGVHIKITGNQVIKELTLDGQEDNRLLKVLNEVIKKSQDIAARKLLQMSGGLKGLLGR